MAPLFIIIAIIAGIMFINQSKARYTRRTAADIGKLMRLLAGVFFICLILAMASK